MRPSRTPTPQSPLADRDTPIRPDAPAPAPPQPAPAVLPFAGHVVPGIHPSIAPAGGLEEWHLTDQRGQHLIFAVMSLERWNATPPEQRPANHHVGAGVVLMLSDGPAGPS